MLKNQHGWFLQSYELLPLLGLKPGHKLPEGGFGPKEVMGVTFICKPARAPRYHNGKRVKSSAHRLYYHCKACNRMVPAGRAAQHNKGLKHKDAKTRQ